MAKYLLKTENSNFSVGIAYFHHLKEYHFYKTSSADLEGWLYKGSEKIRDVYAVASLNQCLYELLIKNIDIVKTLDTRPPTNSWIHQYLFMTKEDFETCILPYITKEIHNE